MAESKGQISVIVQGFGMEQFTVLKHMAVAQLELTNKEKIYYNLSQFVTSSAFIT